MSSAIILCVDDEKNNRDLLRAVLVPRGFEVVEAADGHRALAAAKEYKPDLILLDVMLPDTDGYTVCRTLKDDPGVAPAKLDTLRLLTSG